MTISSTVRIAGPYIGSGAATVFPFAFKVFAAAEMQVAKLNTTSNVEIILVLNTDYTVTLNGDQNGTPGGTITLPAVLASGYNLTITSDIANLQPTDLTNQGGFYPEVITDALDRATIQIQQLDQNSRAIKIPLSDGVLDMTTPVVAARQGKYLAFDSLGLPVASVGTGNDSALRTDLADASASLAGSRLSGFRQTGTGATARTVDAKLKDTVSVKDFGAVGDGVTDDTAAITLAIQSNRKILFPTGTYLVTSQIIKTSLSNVYLIGDGAGNSKILCSSTSTFTNSAIGFVTSSFVEITGLTIDQNNNASLSSLYPVFIAISSNNITIKNCKFVRYTYIACAFNSCTQSYIENNFFTRDVAVNTENYAINVSSSVSISKDIIVNNNYSLYSGSLYQGFNIQIHNNSFLYNQFGAGINTSQGVSAASYGNYIITNNTCNFGSGIDINSVNVAGMEILGYNNIISGNICLQNGGVGIAVIGYSNIISNNICAGNGTNLSATDAYRSGILVAYVDATQNANNSFIIGNKCYDLGASTQKYGYYEQGSSLSGVSTRGNDFTGNITNAMYILNPTSGSYDTQGWISYTPTITSSAGTITTVGTCVGKYKLIDKTCFVELSCTITTNGTGSGSNLVTLPVNAAANTKATFSGREDGATGTMLLGYAAGAAACSVTTYNSLYPGGNGYIIRISGSYQTL